MISVLFFLAVEIFQLAFDGMKTTNLLIFLADGDLSVNLSHDSLDLILCNSQVGVNLLLVNFVSLGKREHGDETKDHKSESVEPGANVSHHPEEDAKFDGVDHVFNEDEPSQFPDICGHV